jgi:hypothetical protein
MTIIYTARTRILLFAVAGVVSGVISGLAQYVLPDIPWIQQHYPAVVLGVTLYLCGIYLAGIQSRKPLLSLLALIIFCILGWRISIDVGYSLGGPAPFVTAGAMGALVVAWGWLLAWGIPARDWKFILLVTLAGTLGGLVFQIADTLWVMKEPLWELILFSEWQGLLLASIAIAQQRLKNQNA